MKNTIIETGPSENRNDKISEPYNIFIDSECEYKWNFETYLTVAASPIETPLTVETPQCTLPVPAILTAPARASGPADYSSLLNSDETPAELTPAWDPAEPLLTSDVTTDVPACSIQPQLSLS